MRKHTSGEWSVLNHLGVFVIADGGLTVAEITYQLPDANGESERLANANLMASAPYLMEALEGLLGAYENMMSQEFNYPGDPWSAEGRGDEDAMKAIAAIKRAKGETE